MALNGHATSDTSAAPFWLLARVNALQAWRKLKSIRSNSALLAACIGLFVVGYQCVSFFLFQHGLRFLNNFPALGEILIERLFYLLFAFLFILLLFSNIVIGYANFFRNRETSFLTSLPVSSQTIFRWKFVESALLASWAFVFLVAPLLAAYGLTRAASWHFYVMTVAALGMFIVLPGVAGAWVALNLARYLDRRAFQVTAVTITVIVIPLLTIWFRPEPLLSDSADTRVLSTLDKLLQRTHFAEWAWLPSFWLTSGVLQWADAAVSAAVFFLSVLLSYVLLFGYLAFTRTGNLFYEAFSIVQSRESIFVRWNWFRRWRERRGAFEYPVGLLEKVFRKIHRAPPDVLALLVKDARIFWRDTTQWGQTLVLFGLLAVYILNLRHFSQGMSNPFWVHLVSYLNLGACALNLATLTTRFVFPQFSLEGKRLWIIGLAPLGLVEALRAKFWLANRAALCVTLGLIWLSCHMLQIPWTRTLYLGLIIATMTFTLTALAIGLGALYPNLREDNPTKIVSGFGGTLCLVLSFLYIVCSVTLLAIGSPWGWRGETSAAWLWGSWLGFAFLSFVLGWIPFHLGLRRVRSFEL